MTLASTVKKFLPEKYQRYFHRFPHGAYLESMVSARQYQKLSKKFAECHFKGSFTEMERITNEDLAAMRLSVATQLLSFKHFLIDTCPKSGFAVDEAEQKDLHRIKQVDEDVVITENVAEEIFHGSRAAPSSGLVGYHKPKDTDGQF
ncbi:hypothetical protein DPMN_109066 [Dreissena polymorpha]|uniref:Uncharacterized protein n=1 Tax=Dreissena polymorpha TaxID=45954 RepID=A0A9D4KAB7_DREPO|nr:hypothetical protein DPMN_109066 [Dreissena polymorpha]